MPQVGMTAVLRLSETARMVARELARDRYFAGTLEEVGEWLVREVAVTRSRTTRRSLGKVRYGHA